MSKIKVGDTVRAHLNAAMTGTVVEILSEQSSTWTASGPLTDETYCMVKLKNGNAVKLKLSDLYVEY